MLRSSIGHSSLLLCCVFSLLVMSACGSSSNSNPTPPSSDAYLATATVGDFIAITIDHGTDTLSYVNHSNADSDTVPFVVQPDGRLLINGDTIGYEVSGFGVVVGMNNTGPGASTPSLVIGVTPKPGISTATMSGRVVNIMQFRTDDAGIEVGHSASGADFPNTTATHMYRPSTDDYDSGGLGGGAVVVTVGGGGTYLQFTAPSETQPTYVADTDSGMLFIDNPNGSFVAVAQAAGPAFDPLNAGTYRGVIYNNDNSTASFEHTDIAITIGGVLTSTGASGAVFGPVYLIPVSQHAGLTTGLAGNMNGVFVLHDSADATTLPVNPQNFIYVMFAENTMLIAHYENKGVAGFEYAYGMAMRTMAGVVQIDRAQMKQALSLLLPRH